VATNWLQKFSEPYKIAELSGLYAPKENFKCVLLLKIKVWHLSGNDEKVDINGLKAA